MRALVVDDSSTVRKFIKAALSKLEIDAVEAEDGKQAFDYLTTNGEIDFMLVDWNMPVMDGLELVKAVRAETRFKDIPMVMVTTEAEFERIAEALTAGANEYLMKPFTPDALEGKLKLAGILGA